jgi:hypothetical protein
MSRQAARRRPTDLPGRRVLHQPTTTTTNTEKINALLKTFPCPVFVHGHWGRRRASTPGHIDLPCLTTESITDCTVVPDRHTRRWREFQLTFYDYPGQTLYHSALLVEHDNGERLFFLGDSFTPSGIDDYCLLNRNLMHEGEGYLRCLDILATLPDNCMLVNEHVSPVFQFDAPQLALMRKTLAERKALLAELFPWDDANYGIDEQGSDLPLWTDSSPRPDGGGRGADTEPLGPVARIHRDASCARRRAC